MGQTAIVQSCSESSSFEDAVAISHTVPLPRIQSPYDVLIRILAVSLNPTDIKMITRFRKEGKGVGCDFCGIIKDAGPSATLSLDMRVCGAVFPYSMDESYQNGSFSQWVVTDSRHLLQVPASWSDTQAAALGAVGWGTSGLSLSDPLALGLTGLPTNPVKTRTPVLVYGGATATGSMAIQLLSLSGYAPIAVCSRASAPTVIQYGAIGTADYDSADCVEKIMTIAKGDKIRYALDCITDANSASTCFAVLARTGGSYACLENFHESWRTRRAVKTKVVMGFEMQGLNIDLGHNVYSRPARPEMHDLGVTWTREMQLLLDAGNVTTQPVRELDNDFAGVLRGLHLLRDGNVRGEKLVARLSSSQEAGFDKA